MNELIKFDFENKNIEVIILNNEPLFSAKNIGEALEIIDINSSLKSLDNDEVVKLTNSLISSNADSIRFRKLHNTGENFLTEAGQSRSSW